MKVSCTNNVFDAVGQNVPNPPAPTWFTGDFVRQRQCQAGGDPIETDAFSFDEPAHWTLMVDANMNPDPSNLGMGSCP